MGSLALGVPEVPTPDFSRMGLVHNAEIGLGSSSLSPTTRARQVASSGRAELGLQMAACAVPVLERRYPLRCSSLRPKPPETRSRDEICGNALEKRLRFYQVWRHFRLTSDLRCLLP